MLVLKGVSLVASAETLRLMKCALPCDDNTVFWMGGGRQIPAVDVFS